LQPSRYVCNWNDIPVFMPPPWLRWVHSSWIKDNKPHEVCLQHIFLTSVRIYLTYLDALLYLKHLNLLHFILVLHDAPDRSITVCSVLNRRLVVIHTSAFAHHWQRLFQCCSLYMEYSSDDITAARSLQFAMVRLLVDMRVNDNW
jgi:hypothetical protein